MILSYSFPLFKRVVKEDPMVVRSWSTSLVDKVSWYMADCFLINDIKILFRTGKFFWALYNFEWGT